MSNPLGYENKRAVAGATAGADAALIEVLAFLGRDASAYVNGVNLLVDAGFSAAMTTGPVGFAALA